MDGLVRENATLDRALRLRELQDIIVDISYVRDVCFSVLRLAAERFS